MASNEDYSRFLSYYSPLIEELADSGWSKEEACHRLATLFPEESPRMIHRAVFSRRWTFNTRTENILNNVMMSAAVWYAVAVTHDMEPDPHYAAAYLDPVILQDIPRIFAQAKVSPEAISVILGKCGAALKALSENPYIRLDEVSYDDFFEDVPEEARDIVDEVSSWPPHRQIIEDRLGDGSWSVALMRVGVCPPDLEDFGISVSPSSLTDLNFRNALGEFLSYCIRYDRKPTVLLYGSWSVSRNPLGRVPLLGAVRSKYGSWYRGLKNGRRLINDALKMSSLSNLPVNSSSKIKTSTASSNGVDVKALYANGIGVVHSPTDQHSDTSGKNPWEVMGLSLYEALRELPWGQSVNLHYLSQVLHKQKNTTPRLYVLRSPSGYRCDLITENTDSSHDSKTLEEHGWAPATADYYCWAQTFQDAESATQEIVYALRWILNYTKPELFYFEDQEPSGEVSSS
ncbi:hypothetical protein ACN083_06315 [Rothia sp. CCM 9418]|uniref:hypothetical protein n=1 Tax=Rothia sp. CCM 9418 TaxID=3402661 RepID=UPI003AD89999